MQSNASFHMMNIKWITKKQYHFSDTGFAASCPQDQALNILYVSQPFIRIWCFDYIMIDMHTWLSHITKTLIFVQHEDMH